jgi:uncharacterized protein (UPF0128 family)
MGKRQVFYDDSGNELASYVMENGNLYLEIKNGETTSKIILDRIDAVLFIMDLYRMRKHLE